MYYADIAVHGKDKNLQLLVEAKNKHQSELNFTRQDAIFMLPL
ncbi:hypothetical protein [Anabaena sphaerica]|nr:hypothetical protein [Anabaena sphaerica]